MCVSAYWWDETPSGPKTDLRYTGFAGEQRPNPGVSHRRGEPRDNGWDKKSQRQCGQSFIHSFIPVISIAPHQVIYYSEALPTTARILYRSFTPKRTGNCR